MDRETKSPARIELNIDSNILCFIVLVVMAVLLVVVFLKLRKNTSKFEVLLLFFMTCFAAYLVISFGQEIMPAAFITFLFLATCTFCKTYFAET